MTDNPFEAPVAPRPACPGDFPAFETEQEFFRIADRLVAPGDAVLPNRCVVCGTAQDVSMTTETFSRGSLGMLSSTEPTTLQMGLCVDHRLRIESAVIRWRALLFGGLTVAAVARVVSCLGVPWAATVCWFALVIMGLSAVLLRRVRPVRLTQRMEDEAHYKGIHPVIIEQVVAASS